MAKSYDELYELITEKYAGTKIDATKKKIKDTAEEISGGIEDKMIGMRMSTFKKKYKYDAEKKTIVVNGKTFKVDLDIHNPHIVAHDENGNEYRIDRTTAAETPAKDPQIFIGKEFFQVHGSKARDGILQHEIGHLKMHSQTAEGKHFDKDFAQYAALKQQIKDAMKAQIHMIEKETGEKTGVTDKMIDDWATWRANMLAKHDPATRKWLESGTKGIPEKTRERIFKTMEKYTGMNPHNVCSELEADLYGMHHSSKRAMKSGLNQIHNQAHKEIRKEYKKAADHQYQYIEDELANRHNAMDDKELAKEEIYKRESTIDALYEAWIDDIISEGELSLLVESVLT